jgi:hypothetical protein
MANEISYTNYSTTNLVDATSRYNSRPIIHYGSDKKATFAIYNKSNISMAPGDKFYEITKSMEFRPELVSHQFYGLPDLWWRIMAVNKMKDVMEFRAGRNIVIPNSYLM